MAGTPYCALLVRRILLADDHQIVREGIRALLERGGFDVVAEAADGHDALEIWLRVRPDIAILDLSMPRMNGMDSAREILAQDARAAIILLTVHTEEFQIAGALHVGIRGYVIKTQATDELVQAIHEVSAGGVYLSPKVSGVIVGAYLSGHRASSDPLSVRERQVLQLITEGKTTRDLSAALGVSVKTAESYRARLMAKLDIHDIAGLVRYAIRHGLIDA